MVSEYIKLKTASSLREEMTHKTQVFYRSDELCRFEVKRMHIMQPCGRRAFVEIGGRWYCTGHGKKVQAAVDAAEEKSSASP